MFGSALVLSASLVLQSGAAPSRPADALGEAYFQFVQGRSLEARGEVQAAIAAFRRALELAPSAAEIHAELAGLYAREGRAAESVREAEAALLLEATNREAHRILGLVKAALADRPVPDAATASFVPEAIGHLEQALIGVRDPGAELTLGRLYLRNGQPDRAIATLTAFLRDQPGYPEALSLLAEAYEGVGKTAEAAEVWGALVGSGPQGRNYRIRYATALANAGDLKASRDVLGDVSKDSPRDLSVWYLLSQVERRAGNIAGAEDAALRVIALDAADARGPIALAEARIAGGNFKGAIEALTPRLSIASDEDVQSGVYARVATTYATAQQESGDTSGAVATLEAAHRRVPDDAELWFELGAAYDRANRIDDAERTFRALIGSAPANAAALNYLGYMLAERGRKLEEAVELVSRALAIDAGNPSYLDTLGWAYFKLGRLDAARDPIEKAATAAPQASVIQAHLGDVYFELKRYQDALAAFDRALGGDRRGLDAIAVAKKRDRARELAGK